jgi:hypothetical protein
MVYTTTSAVLTVPYIVPTAESPVLPYPTQRLFLEMPVPLFSCLASISFRLIHFRQYKPLQTTMYKVAAAHGWHVIDGIEVSLLFLYFLLACIACRWTNFFLNPVRRR